MKNIILTICIGLSLISCSKNGQNQEQHAVVQSKEIVSQLKGSLVQSSENSPNAFYEMVVNNRPQFTNQVQDNGSFIEQLISNNDNSLVIKAYWKKDQDIWQCYKVLLLYTKQIDSDSLQVAMRFPYRFIDEKKIEDKISNLNATPARLSNGALVSSYIKGDAKIVFIN